MQLQLLITKPINLDLKNIPNDLKLNIVSFEKSVLDKYKRDQIELDKGGNAVALSCYGRILPIDVGEHHVSTFLYKLASLPEDEIKHFQSKNIMPIRLGNAAYRRWVKGDPTNN